jgi:hypothetical protein
MLGRPIHGSLASASALVALVGSCATLPEVKYRATYSHTSIVQVVELAYAATLQQGYTIGQQERKLHFFTFITTPTTFESASTVDVAYLVQIVFEKETGVGGNCWSARCEFAVIVVPKAFHGTEELPDDQVPAGATTRASAPESMRRLRSEG